MDWKILIADLMNAGMTQADIAAHIGVKQPTISGIACGAQQDMRWKHGERLRELHDERIATAFEAAGASAPVPLPTDSEETSDIALALTHGVPLTPEKTERLADLCLKAATDPTADDNEVDA